MKTFWIIVLLLLAVLLWGMIVGRIFAATPIPPEVFLDLCQADGTAVYDTGAKYDGGCEYKKGD